jgi:hypothetical protein
LTQAVWEERHGRPVRTDGGFIQYEGGALVVMFREGRANYVERVWGDRNAVPLADAQAAGRALAPADAQLTRTYTSRNDRQVDLYRSTALKDALPNNPWIGGEPGDFIVIYRQLPTGRVTSIVVATGNNP